MKILVLKPSSMGDVVHALPAVACIRRHFPSAHISWLVNPEWAPLLEGNADIDGVILFPRGDFRGIAGMIRFWRWFLRTRRERFDLVLDFQGLLRSAFIGRACCRGEMIGLSDAREGARFFHHRVAPVEKSQHAVERYLRLAAATGAETGAPLEWQLPPGEPVPGLPENFVLLHPFARGEGKSLSHEEIETFCAVMELHPVVVAGKLERAGAIAAPCVNLINRTSLPQLIWLIRRARYVVSVDSGPMHIAAAVTSRMVGIHTWSEPQRVGPCNPEAWVRKGGDLWRIGNPEQKQPANDMRALAAFVSLQCRRNSCH